MPKKLDLSELFGMKQKQNERYTSKHLVNLHEFYLLGEIESADEYIEWFDIIRNSSKTDVIKIYINSPGGDLFTAIQFMRVLNECEGTVIVSIEGACMSAATMIMLCADQFEISEHCMFMFHNYSGGQIGKGGEMYDSIVAERAWSDKLLRSVYGDFLTEKEITSILENKDIWMDSDEVIKRMKKRAKKLEKEVDKDDVEC